MNKDNNFFSACVRYKRKLQAFAIKWGYLNWWAQNYKIYWMLFLDLVCTFTYISQLKEHDCENDYDICCVNLKTMNTMIWFWQNFINSWCKRS